MAGRWSMKLDDEELVGDVQEPLMVEFRGVVERWSAEILHNSGNKTRRWGVGRRCVGTVNGGVWGVVERWSAERLHNSGNETRRWGVGRRCVGTVNGGIWGVVERWSAESLQNSGNETRR